MGRRGRERGERDRQIDRETERDLQTDIQTQITLALFYVANFTSSTVAVVFNLDHIFSILLLLSLIHI